jgi:uncharacterized damage-inducible protein DinB
MGGFSRQCQTAMTMTTVLLDMIAHMRWADALVADALIAQNFARQEGLPNGNPVALFAHIAATEHLWFSRIEGVTPRHAVWPMLTPSEALFLAAQHADLFEELVARDDGQELERVVSYRNSAGKDFRNTVRDIVTHVALHGSYHRGQIARLIRASGGDPPYTDYIQFMRREQLA